MRSLIAGLFVLMIMISSVSTGTPVTAQGGWDQEICDGNEAVVWRVVNGTTSTMPSEEGCDSDDDMGWLVVEPWGPNGLNPDRACYASTWDEAYEVSQERDWVNGSAWRVKTDVAENPLVVLCTNVRNDSGLGLNPGEGQIELRTIDSTIARASILLSRHDMTMGDYAEEYPEHPISVLFGLFADLGLGE